VIQVHDVKMRLLLLLKMAISAQRCTHRHTQTHGKNNNCSLREEHRSRYTCRRFMNNRDQRSSLQALAPFPRNLPRNLDADSPIPLRYARSGRQGSAGAHAFFKLIKCSEIYQDRVSSNHLLADGRAETNTSSSFLSFSLSFFFVCFWLFLSFYFS